MLGWASPRPARPPCLPMQEPAPAQTSGSPKPDPAGPSRAWRRRVKSRLSHTPSRAATARLIALDDDPHLVLQAPAPPTLPPGNELHHAIHPHTLPAALKSSWRRQDAQSQTALGEGIQTGQTANRLVLYALTHGATGDRGCRCGPNDSATS